MAELRLNGEMNLLSTRYRVSSDCACRFKRQKWMVEVLRETSSDIGRIGLTGEKRELLFDDHWEQALRYLRNKGMGKHRRGSNSESGRRLLRRLEKNHDGIRSVGTRQHYMQIYQAIQYLSVDIAEFREQGPQMTGPPRV